MHIHDVQLNLYLITHSLYKGRKKTIILHALSILLFHHSRICHTCYQSSSYKIWFYKGLESTIILGTAFLKPTNVSHYLTHLTQWAWHSQRNRTTCPETAWSLTLINTKFPQTHTQHIINNRIGNRLIQNPRILCNNSKETTIRQINS